MCACVRVCATSVYARVSVCMHNYVCVCVCVCVGWWWVGGCDLSYGNNAIRFCSNNHVVCGLSDYLLLACFVMSTTIAQHNLCLFGG